VVDREVVRLTRNRRRYLDALVAVAAQGLSEQNILPAVVPAPLFLKKRQLAERVVAILKESPMSVPRFVASLTVVGSVAAGAAALAIWMFPLQAAPQSVPSEIVNVRSAALTVDGLGITVDPGAKLLHRTGVFYPHGAKSTGMVLLEASVNSSGDVTDVRVTSGPEDLRKAAIQSVLQWHYAAEGGLPPTIRVAIQFNQAPVDPVASGNSVRKGSFDIGTLASIDITGLSPDLAQRVRDRLPVRVGDPLNTETMRNITETVRQIDEHLQVGYSTNRVQEGRAQSRIHISLGPGPLSPPPPPPAMIGGVLGGIDGGIPGGVPGGTTSADGVQRVRVGGNVQNVNLIRKVVPAYPALAKQARIQGTVRFNAIIGKDGSILNLQTVTGHPLLVPAAMEAVKQWMYKPTLLNNEPVEVITTIDVNFTLSEEPQQQ
jgi:TonB family protein